MALSLEDFKRLAEQHQERLRNMTVAERAEYDKSEAVAHEELQKTSKRFAEELQKLMEPSKRFAEELQKLMGPSNVILEDSQKQLIGTIPSDALDFFSEQTREHEERLKTIDETFKRWNLAGVRLFEAIVVPQVENGDLSLLHDLHDILDAKKIHPPKWLLEAAYASLKHRAVTQGRGHPRTSPLELLRTYVLFQVLKAEYEWDLPIDSIVDVLADDLGLTAGALKKRLVLAKPLMPDINTVDDVNAICALLDISLGDSQRAKLAQSPRRKRVAKRK